MAQQSHFNMEPSKITCPHCGSNECFTQMEGMPDGSVVESYLCMECGYTSTTLNKIDSNIIKQYEETTAELIKALRWVDPKTNLVWYPIVLNFPSYGIIFPDGVSETDWKWKAAPAVDIPQEEREKYPIPGQSGQYYERRIDMKQGKDFAPTNFFDACQFLGFIK